MPNNVFEELLGDIAREANNAKKNEAKRKLNAIPVEERVANLRALLKFNQAIFRTGDFVVPAPGSGINEVYQGLPHVVMGVDVAEKTMSEMPAGDPIYLIAAHDFEGNVQLAWVPAWKIRPWTPPRAG